MRGGGGGRRARRGPWPGSEEEEGEEARGRRFRPWREKPAAAPRALLLPLPLLPVPSK